MRYILVTGPQGRGLYATSDSHPLEPFDALVAPLGLTLHEVAAPTGLLSLAALVAQSALDLGTPAAPAADPLELAIDEARKLLQVPAARKLPLPSALTDRVMAHGRAEVKRTRVDLATEPKVDIEPVSVAQAAAPPIDDYGDSDRPLPAPAGGGAQMERPSAAMLDLNRAGSSTIIEVGADGNAYQMPGWRPTQLQNHPAERAPGNPVRVR